MPNIIKTILEKNKFNEPTLETIFLSKDRGIGISRGKPKEGGKIVLQAVTFDDSKWDDMQVSDWMQKNEKHIEMMVSLPDEASNLWLKSYENHCLTGATSDQAAEFAWGEVKKVWYEDRNAQWYKFAESWADSIKQTDRPTMELLKIGSYEGKSDFTEADLDEIVDNFKKYHPSVPATVDHQQAGIAMGWLDNVFRVDGTLFGTFRDLVTDLANGIKEKRWVNRSVEIYKNLNYNGKRVGKALKAVTFLGAITPHVKGMAAPNFTDNSFSCFSIDHPEWFQIESSDKFPITENSEAFLVELTPATNMKQKSSKILAVPDFEGIKQVTAIPIGSGVPVSQALRFDKANDWTKTKVSNWLNNNLDKIKLSSNPKGVKTLEITQEQLDAMIKKGAEAAVTKATATFADDKVKLEKENKDLKDKEARDFKARVKTEAESSFSELIKNGKALPFMKDRYVALFEAIATSEEKLTFSDKTDPESPQVILEKIFSEIPKELNLVKMAEQTKDAGEHKDEDENIQTDDDYEGTGFKVDEDSAKELVEMQEVAGKHKLNLSIMADRLKVKQIIKKRKK